MNQENETREKTSYRVVGVIHLPPLPGSARGGTAREFSSVLDRVKFDATAWAEAGADALIVENFGDVPFHKDSVGPETVAMMTVAVLAARDTSALPVGVNVLRNDVVSAVAVAAAGGGTFVRANVYVGAAVTDQGVIEGRADDVQALIRRLGAEIVVWADVDVKHAAPLAPRPAGELAQDAVYRGLASAVIVTGSGTGQPVQTGDLQAVREAVPTTPLYVGSGATAQTLPALLTHADGVIVGTAAKRDRDLSNPIDIDLAREIVIAGREIRPR